MSRQIQGSVAERGFAQLEHRELVPWLDRLHDVGCSVGWLAASELAVAMHRIVVWLERDLEAHAAWEEAWLYPEIDVRVGTTWATRLMRFEHQQIRASVRHLSAAQAALAHELTRAQGDDLRYLVFGLEARLRSHLEAEDHILLPLFDDAATLADAIDRANERTGSA